MILIDSDVLIDASRHRGTTLVELRAREQTRLLAISGVSRLELIAGCPTRRECHRMETFLRQFHIVHVSTTIEEKAFRLLVKYRHSHGLAVPDALIAATALIAKTPFLTRNLRDFRFIDRLNLI